MVAGLALCASLGGARPGHADENPVLVELFTSQGCSSCPPADELFRDLAQRSDVIALSLHVDYWDYIGWADTFARPEFTERQKGYAHAAGERMIYTPQMVVGGAVQVPGTKPMRLLEAIERLGEVPVAVDLTVRRQGREVQIAAEARQADTGAMPGPLVVQMMRYTPEETVQIGRGENAGRTVTYANVVNELATLGVWDGRAPLVMQVTVDGRPDPVVVVLQREGHGPVVAAALAR
jgi:hypothetical protein